MPYLIIRNACNNSYIVYNCAIYYNMSSYEFIIVYTWDVCLNLPCDDRFRANTMNIGFALDVIG